jgi:hypothetical protein
MNNRLNQLICIHFTAVFLVLVGGGFVVAGWVPPFSPHEAAHVIAEKFRHHGRIRLAAEMFFFGSATFVAPACAIAAQMRRIEGRGHAMANLQLVSAAIGVLAIQIPGALWLVISYRTGTPDWVVSTLNDLAWFMLLGAIGPAVMQNLSIAFCVLGSDGSVYPRWVGYANLWLAGGLLPGLFLPFFKTGPLAWNGILAFWVVAIAFFAWVIMMYVTTVRAINSDTRPAGAAVPA